MLEEIRISLANAKFSYLNVTLLLCVTTFHYYKFKYLNFLQFQKYRPDINRIQVGHRQDTARTHTGYRYLSFLSNIWYQFHTAHLFRVYQYVEEFGGNI